TGAEIGKIGVSAIDIGLLRLAILIVFDGIVQKDVGLDAGLDGDPQITNVSVSDDLLDIVNCLLLAEGVDLDRFSAVLIVIVADVLYQIGFAVAVWAAVRVI